MSGSKGRKSAGQSQKQCQRQFMCGVCEGFYGKPWSQRQRRELFSRMHRMGLSTYLYAPKDDYKHRLHWRQLYSESEADEMKTLIKAAKENNVDFVYALSPGLDIVYSDKENIDAIKSKLKQVAKLGCLSFALLFDDIDTDLSFEDVKSYKRLGLAQSAITNDIYKYLDNPAIFLFCPTEYCSTRAVPSILHSNYLNDIGTELNPGIDILWTGHKVVSNRITPESIKDVTDCLKRPPVIWDNLHANDYDQTRLFLGPYEGRTPDLVGKLRGVLTNPNCEFEANFIAMHTLAQWSKNKVENYLPSNGLVAKASEKKSAKNENDSDRDKDSTCYQAKLSLMRAVEDWIPEMYEAKNHLGVEDKEVSSPSRSTRQATKAKANKGKEGCKNSVKRKMEELEPLNVTDLSLLCDLFYLPFEHGPRAIHLLRESHWLLSHVGIIGSHSNSPREKQPPEVQEWYDRAISFHDLYRAVTMMVDKFVNIPNRVLLYELYPYVGDMRSVLSMINGSIKWHGLGRPENEPFRTGEQEPWVYRGGLHAEFRRLLPIEGENDMFPPPHREPRSNSVYTIRPYFPDDKEAVYAVCRKTCDDGNDGSNIFPKYPDLVADESVGGFLAVSREFCYVVEDDADIVGYVVATPDARQYQKVWLETWIPQMKKKYPKAGSKNDKGSSSQDIIQTFHTPPKTLPDLLIEKYPANVQLGFLSRKMADLTIPRQLLGCAVKTLRAKGTKGLHSLVHASHINIQALHVKLGFVDVTDDSTPEDMLVFGLLI